MTTQLMKTDDDLTAARICAELLRQGIAFVAEKIGDEWKIHLTGY